MSFPDFFFFLSQPCFAGFTAGSIEFDDFRLRIISVELQVSIVNVEYRYAPLRIVYLVQKSNFSCCRKARPRGSLSSGFR